MKIKAFLLATLVQASFILLFFIGGLLDPLLGLYVAGFYFFVVGYFLAYRFFLGRLITKASSSSHK